MSLRVFFFVIMFHMFCSCEKTVKRATRSEGVKKQAAHGIFSMVIDNDIIHKNDIIHDNDIIHENDIHDNDIIHDNDHP